MKELVITKAAITSYLQFLRIQEKSKGTLEKYQRELLDLEKYLKGKKLQKKICWCGKKIWKKDTALQASTADWWLPMAFFLILAGMICG